MYVQLESVDMIMCKQRVTCNCTLCVQVIIYGATNPKGHEVQAGALLIHHPKFSQGGTVNCHPQI